jgi:hypothetical protein
MQDVSSDPHSIRQSLSRRRQLPSSFSIKTDIDSFPTADLVIDGHFLPQKPILKAHPLLAVCGTPSPDKSLPITPSSTSSSPIPTDGNSPDSASPEDPIDQQPPSSASHLKILPTRFTKRNQALLDLIESERDYVSDLVLIRDIYLPNALGMCQMFVVHIWHSSQHPALRLRITNLGQSHTLHPHELLIFLITRPTYDSRRRANHLWQHFLSYRARRWLRYSPSNCVG